MNNIKSYNIPALRRAVQILDLLQENTHSLTAADIVKRLRIPKSTGHGLLHVMLELEMLQRCIDGTFTLGPRLSKWGSGFLANVDLLEAFNNISVEKKELLAYTLTLSVPEKHEVIYIACRNSNAPLGFTFKIGMRLPMIFTATGKAMLATWPDSELEAFAKTYTLPEPLTDHSISEWSTFMQEVVATRKRGFSIDNGQIRDGMICLGGAIKNHTGKAIAGIAISLMEQEATDEHKRIIGARITQMSHHLSRLLGYHI